MENRLKDSKQQSLFRKIEKVLSKGEIFKDGVPSKYFPQLFFFLFLGVTYIGYTHYVNKLARKTDTLKKQVEDLRADYTTMKANYMYESKLSEVSKKVKEYGLREPSSYPTKIKVKASEYR